MIRMRIWADMIHEAMVLDYGGPDLGIIHYAAALKLWLFTSICSLMIVPAGLLSGFGGLLVFVLAQFLLGGLLALVEAVSARFRFLKVRSFCWGCRVWPSSQLLCYYCLNRASRKNAGDLDTKTH